MGKKKQQKLYKLNNKKQDSSKQKISQIIKELSLMKKQNTQQYQPQDKSTMDLGLFKKKIKKEQKQKKYNAKKDKQQEIVEQKQQIRIEAPKINIFATDNYESGVKTVINNKLPSQQAYSETKLIDETVRLMGGDLNFQTFGEKPLRIIQEEEKVELSDDEDQPNSIKNITHPNLQIPEGNYKFNRTKEIEQFRQKLPIFMKQQQIIETINHHLVTLICGQTGSGKSTQIGQFLIEKNYHSFGKIAITQPRRLATIALANRVAEETNTKIAELVGFQVRHQRRDSQSTLIKYLTDGILLNEMSSDYLLKTYSVIVIDEAHERKVNTDILIGLLSKLVLIRYNLSLQGKCHPLRLVIMSATMRVSDFQNKVLFDYMVPIINVQARMFPVTVYFQKQTPEDYKTMAVNKCLKIHRKLPQGDVLVFLTGKDEIHEVATMLQQQLSRDSYQQSEDQNEMVNQEEVQTKIPQSHVIYCLYSSLPMTQQQAIFKPTPANTRKFIISTNIAETSITVPNIRYVIDSGQQKHRYHEGVWKWRKGWGSRAMAEQRSGRAGRTTHGYCYRLYSSALYANIMQEYPLPEISKLPLEGVVLQLKSIGIPNVYNFPFPTTPQHQKLKNTLLSLQQIKALEGEVGEWSEKTKVTQLGKVLSFLPLDPKLGKILLMGRKQGVQQHCLLLVILLTVQSIFQQQNYKPKQNSDLNESNAKGKYLQQMRAKSNSFKNTYKKYILDGHNGDMFTCINILGDFFTRLYANKVGNIHQKIKKQAKELQLNQNVMRDIFYNTDQIAEIYQTLCNEKVNLQTYRAPTHNQIKTLLEILLCNFVKNTCRLQEKSKYKNRLGHDVYIHQLSDTYLRNNLFLACTEFYSTEHGRTYMRFPFPVTNFQLLSTFGQVNPPTDFVWRNGELVGLATGTIYGWEIPNLFIENVAEQIKYIYVAKYLLQGKIFQPIKALEKYLKAPTNIIKPASLDYKVQKLVQALKIHKLWQAGQILKRLQKDKKFLKEELRVWVQMKNFDEVYEKIREKIIQSK